MPLRHRPHSHHLSNMVFKENSYGESSPLVTSSSAISDDFSETRHPWFRHLNKHWLPPKFDDRKRRRSLRNRVFLVLTEPDSSVGSAAFFALVVIAIALMNIVMMMQTMNAFQFTPTDCRACGGSASYIFDDDSTIHQPTEGVDCVCPPSPFDWTTRVLDTLVRFFSIEWILRVSTFGGSTFSEWFNFLTNTTTVLDFLATFPYYMESLDTNGLMSLRLLRLFRVFQLLRLGQYHTTFNSLINVLNESLIYLKLLGLVLLFGASFFGSMLYWLEKGDWQVYNGEYQFVRINDGQLEPSPFTSIPATFWWFLVTATTVGYGDIVPSTPAGKWVGAASMLTGVLVIAFPVSVFSDLWSRELKNAGVVPDNSGSSKQGDNRDQEDLLEQSNAGVFMESNDLALLREHVQTIRDAQREIDRILERNQLT